MGFGGVLIIFLVAITCGLIVYPKLVNIYNKAHNHFDLDIDLEEMNPMTSAEAGNYLIHYFLDSKWDIDDESLNDKMKIALAVEQIKMLYPKPKREKLFTETEAYDEYNHYVGIQKK